MAVVMAEKYYVLGSKLSIGAFDQGYVSVSEPDVNLDVFGTTRFRGGIDLTDSSLLFGGPTCSVGGNGSAAFGSYNAAQGYNSISQGDHNVSGGNNSITVGQGLSAGCINEAVFGQWNVGNADSSESGALLVVGDGLDADHCSDALRVYSNGVVFANSITTNSSLQMMLPSGYAGPLVESCSPERRGIAVDANTTYVYGPSVQLATSTANSSALQPHVTLQANGTVVNSDCTLFGNLTIVGQTFSTVTKTYTTVASTVECSDPIITVAHGYQPNGNLYDIGLVGERPSGNTGVVWDESKGEWAFILTQESSEASQFHDFTYANLHVQDLSAHSLITNGPITQNGDLKLVGNAVMNNLSISNSCTVGGSFDFKTSIIVNGPSILNTLFVANQVTLNDSLLTSEPDSWPIGQSDNRFARAYLNTVDVYDKLQLPGGVQDTYPARFGAFGEANIYLYTTSPFYQDTVGIYFDKGQNQLPYGKSALVQQYDRWALKTMGTDRLSANTVTGNLKVANELVLMDNLTCYGVQTNLLNNLAVGGSFQANTATWLNGTSYGGDLLPTSNNSVCVGSMQQRFGNVWIDKLDVLQTSNIAGLSLGSNNSTAANFYSTSSGPVSLALSVAGGASTISQYKNSFQLSGAGQSILTANTVNGNVILAADQLTMGNSVVSGQLAVVQNMLNVTGSFTGNSAFFANNVSLKANIEPYYPNVFQVGNGAARFRTGYFNTADLYDTTCLPLKAGSAGATNVYIYSNTIDTVSCVGINLDRGGNATSFIQQNPSNVAWGVNGQARLVLDNMTGNLAVANDVFLSGNLTTAGPQTILNNLTTLGNISGNCAFWANASVFQGPLLAASNNAVTIGNASARFKQASLQRVELYDSAFPIRAGTANTTNIYVYSDSVVPSDCTVITLDQGGNACPTGKTSLIQNVNSFSICTSNLPRLVANTLTGNISVNNDLLVVGNLQLLGQSSTINQDLRVLGHVAANTIFVANTTVVDGSLLTLTPNVWTIGSPANRFAAAYLNRTDVYNQDGSTHRFGSSQTSNVGIFTDSTSVGQTATVYLDKGGLGRTSLSQDGTRFSIQQNAMQAVVVDNTTANVFTLKDSVVGGNIKAYGQTVSAMRDCAVLGNFSANTVSISNTVVLGGNVLPSGNVTLGNASGRFSGVFGNRVDIYGLDPQAVLAGPQTVTLLMSSQGGNAAVTQSNSGLVLATQNLTRVQITNQGNVMCTTDFGTSGNTYVAGATMATAGNVGVQGGQSRYPLDFNNFTGEKTIAFANVGWSGSNAATRNMTYSAANGHMLYVGSNVPGLSVSANLAAVAYGDVIPVNDLMANLGCASGRWASVNTGNITTAYDSSFNGVLVGTLGGGPGFAGFASNVQPTNAFAIAQHASGNTAVNSAADRYVKLATGNVVGASFSAGQLRIGDSAPARRALDVVQDAQVGGTLYAAQVCGYASQSVLLSPASTGWIQLGSLSVGNAAQLKLTLLGQSNLANISSCGGETTIYLSTTANGSSISGSWYCVGLQPLVSNVKVVQASANTYGLYAAQAGNTSAYTASTSLVNASFSYSGTSALDPGTGNGVTSVPQQCILSGFGIYGNSTGYLNNAIGGQPWIFNSNSIIYANYPNVGIGTSYPTANLDVRGSLNFTGALLNNNMPLALSLFSTVTNAYVSSASDPTSIAGNQAISYSSSLRVGDTKAPSGVLELVQDSASAKFGGMNGRVSDISTTANVMSFNIANTSPLWSFTKLANYGNLATRSTLAAIMSDGSYVQASDMRYKRAVRDIGAETLRKLKLLRPREYCVVGSDRVKYGLVAQEVRDVMPEIVHENDAGFLSIEYMSLLPMLLSVVQKLVL